MLVLAKMAAEFAAKKIVRKKPQKSSKYCVSRPASTKNHTRNGEAAEQDADHLVQRAGAVLRPHRGLPALPGARAQVRYVTSCTFQLFFYF
jgi:hypothetical protein